MRLAEMYLGLVNWVNALGPGYDKFAHVNAGLALWLAAILLLRRSPASVWPLVVVVFVETGNELFDWTQSIEWGWRETSADFIATLLWPMVLTLICAFSNRRPGAEIRESEIEHPDSDSLLQNEQRLESPNGRSEIRL